MAGDFMQGDRDSAIVVPFSDDDAATDKREDIAEEPPVGATPEQLSEHKRKKAERTKRMLEEGKAAKEALEAERAEKETLKERLARLEGMVVAQSQQRPAPTANGEDPYKRRLEAVRAKRANAYAAAQAEIKAGAFTDERAKYYEQISNEAEEETIAIHTERALAQREPIRRQEQAQQIWTQKYPDVYQNPQAFQYAKATFERRAALLRPGETLTNEMVDEAMEEARTQFKIGPKRAPTRTERDRMSGISSSGNGGSSRDPAGIVMTPELERIATAAYPDLPKAEALKKWTNKTGKRLRERKVL